jgi:serine O-acetyltransferase
VILSLPRDDLLKYVFRQLDAFFPDNAASENGLRSAFDLALDRLEYCFSHINVRGYADEHGKPVFSHLHSDQYSIFLYYFSNSLWNLSQNKTICDKLILLNRSLHGCWYSYKVILPSVFLFSHPMGTVLGHANYSDYTVFLQNLTVATTQPRSSFGKYVFFGSGTSVMGSCKVGDNVSIGVNSVIYL